MQIKTEYRKGVLFIRLIGRLNNERFLKEINEIIEKIGVNYIVLNLTDTSNVSLDNIESIIKYNKKILKKKKHLFICDTNNQKNRVFQKNIPIIKYETETFSLI